MSNTNMKIIFFSSSDYTVPLLIAIYKKFDLSLLVTRADKPVGRKKILTPSALKQYAQKKDIQVITPNNIHQLSSYREKILQIKPDLGIIADYGLLIPKEIYSIPKHKTLNIHFSHLPKFRGPSPVQYTILLDEKSAGITIFIINEKIDEGDIIWQKEVSLSGNETTPILYQKLFNITASSLPNVISKYIKGSLILQKQDHQKATYTRHIKRKDGFIPATILKKAMKGISPTVKELNNWPLYKEFKNHFSILNFQFLIEKAQQAFTSWPGLWTQIPITVNRKQRIKRLKILKCHLEQKTKLVLDLVQLEGKKPVTWKQFRQGYPNSIFSFRPG